MIDGPRDAATNHGERRCHGLAALAGAAIAGGLAAQRVIHEIATGNAAPDALHSALVTVLDTGDAARIRGFVREVQKFIERAPTGAHP